MEQDAPDLVIVFEALDSTSPLPGFELGQNSGIEFPQRLAEASEDDVPFRVEDLEALFLDEEVLDEEDFSELLQR